MSVAILKKMRVIAASVLVLGLSGLAAAWAMSVTPLQVKIETSGPLSVGQIDVTNRLTDDLPLEVVVQTVSFDDAGEPVYTTIEDESDLFIFPFQVALKSGEKQTFQVRWVGDPAQTENQIYLIRFRQLPVQMDEGVTGVQVVYEMGSLVYVAPPNTTADLSVMSVETSVNEDEAPVLKVRVRNDGARYGLVGEHRLRIRHDGGELLLSQQDVIARSGQGAVPAGGERILSIRLDEALQNPAVDILD